MIQRHSHIPPSNTNFPITKTHSLVVKYTPSNTSSPLQPTTKSSINKPRKDVSRIQDQCYEITPLLSSSPSTHTPFPPTSFHQKKGLISSNSTANVTITLSNFVLYPDEFHLMNHFYHFLTITQPLINIVASSSMLLIAPHS